MRSFFFICSFLILSFLKAQPLIPKNQYILFSGLVVTSDSLKPLPFVAVKHSLRGLMAYTDYLGRFAIAVKQGDTIIFEEIETKTTKHIVPDTLHFSKYYAVKLMVRDTFSLPTIFIHAMPLRSLFDHTIVTKNIPNDELTIAQKNLESEDLKEAMKLKPGDAEYSQLILAQTRANQLYYYKQAPPQNFFSPTAWVQFIQAWQRGDFKKKKKKTSSF